MDIRQVKLDGWQRQVIKRKGNMCLCCGRQTGKSTVVSLKAYYLAMEYPNTTTLVVAAVQRQSSLLFEKIRSTFDLDDRDKLLALKKTGKYKACGNKTEKRKLEKEASIYVEEPTLTSLRLKNGSTIYCVPAGRTGAGIRGFTVDFLIADEAARIPDEVWTAVVPMLSTSKKERGTGWIILLSTPWGKRGYFYDAFYDKDFKSWQIPSTQCTRIPKRFLDKQRRKMSKIDFAQEFLGEFIEAVRQFFASDLITKCATIKEMQTKPELGGRYYLGVDFARYGGDENAFIIAELEGKNMRVIYCETSHKVSTIDPIGRIQNLDKIWHFKRIFVDSGGLGGPILDTLQERVGKSRVIGLDNAARSVQVEEEEKDRRILKEDLYANSLLMMENNNLEMIESGRLISSLKSITFEYTETGRVKIMGKGSHLCEAFVRACWGIKNKGGNLFIY